jgi:hypothetical protein
MLRRAASASVGSDLPRRRRAWRSDRLISKTTWPLTARKRARAAPWEPVPSAPRRQRCAGSRSRTPASG